MVRAALHFKLGALWEDPLRLSGGLGLSPKTILKHLPWRHVDPIVRCPAYSFHGNLHIGCETDQ